MPPQDVYKRQSLNDAVGLLKNSENDTVTLSIEREGEADLIETEVTKEKLDVYKRQPVDKLEMIVDKEMWPMPSYGDLMFEV